MKILFVLGCPNPFPGAGWTRIRFFANAWSDKGHLIEVLGAFSYKSLQKRGGRKQGKVNIFNLVLNMGLNHPLIFALNSVISFIVSTFFLIARNPDIVIVSVPRGDVGLGSLLASIFLKKKVVVDYRDDWEDYTILHTKSSIAKTIYKRSKKFTILVYTKAYMVVSVTPTWVATLKAGGVQKVYLIPDGADVKTFRPCNRNEVRLQLGLPTESFITLFTGKLGGYYMLSETMKAFSVFQKREKYASVKLLLIGGQDKSEKYANEIMGLSEKLGIDNSVICLSGTCDHSKLAKIIASADVGLIPLDKQRGFVWPAKFFEYCACGLPVIATVQADSILGKLIHTYDIGLTVPPNNYMQLANALAKIYEDSGFRSKVKRRARQMVKQHFDCNKWAKELLELLKMNMHKKANFTQS